VSVPVLTALWVFDGYSIWPPPPQRPRQILLRLWLALRVGLGYDLMAATFVVQQREAVAW
jgi:hypothetical protein